MNLPGLQRAGRSMVTWMALCSSASCSGAPSVSMQPPQPGAGSGAARPAGIGGGDAIGAAGMTVTGTAGVSSGASGTGAAPMMAAGASGGGVPPGPGDFAGQLPEPDPSIDFEWEQTRPGAGECQPGRYSGTFNCEYSLMPGMPGILVTGPVELVLERSQDGEFLEITDGQLQGIAQLVFGFRSQLSGQLDCATNALDAQAVDGVYGFGDPSVLPFGNFEGTLSGQLDRGAVALDGEWNLTVAAGGACVGPWNARFMP